MVTKKHISTVQHPDRQHSDRISHPTKHSICYYAGSLCTGSNYGSKKRLIGSVAEVPLAGGSYLPIDYLKKLIFGVAPAEAT